MVVFSACCFTEYFDAKHKKRKIPVFFRTSRIPFYVNVAFLGVI